MKFKLKSKFHPAGDQPNAIKQLVDNLESGATDQVLLGVTGSGKTFTMANVIQKVQKPTLVIAHNKTLAAQLYSEFKAFFPENAVHYFVSYYDYYQPEAYIPHSDTYIEKETDINEEIDKLRSAATAALLSRKDVIVVASVSCIYGLGNPTDYENASMHLAVSDKRSRKQLLESLIDMRYERNDTDFWRGKIRVRGEAVDIFPSYEDCIYRLQFFGNELEKIYKIDYITGEILGELKEIDIFPAKHFIASAEKTQNAFQAIRSEMAEQVKRFKKEGKLIEAQRIEERVNFDLEMIQETGYTNGIENYSRHMDGRREGEPPSCLMDYFPSSRRSPDGIADEGGPSSRRSPKEVRPRILKEVSPRKDEGGKKDFLLFIDESHMTVPQISGMYRGDRARKQTLIDYGFRLPSALDNRPLMFGEFESKLNQTVYVSATPGPYELEKCDKGYKGKNASLSSLPPLRGKARMRGTATKATPHLNPLPQGERKNWESDLVVEQIVRPTGLLDPQVEVRPIKNQIEDLLAEVKKRVAKNQRVLITTLTKRLAEDLAEYLKEIGLSQCRDRISTECSNHKNEKTDLSRSGLDIASDIKVHYLHSEIQTFERVKILRELREGKYDVLVGINLLREGLDLPEVSLVVILDADKEGFLRSETSLIQTFGRASRHVEGRVIMYADKITGSMQRAIKETDRRRKIQEEYNKKHQITPKTITKEISEGFLVVQPQRGPVVEPRQFANLPEDERKHLVRELTTQMNLAAQNLEFERAAKLRDQISSLS